MAWIYLAELEVFQSAYLHGYPQPLIVRQTDTARESYCRAWHRGKSEKPQYGMTLEPSRADTWAEKPLTLSTEDSPARTSALLGLRRAWRESEAAYSSRCSVLLGSFDRNSSSLKMSQGSLFQDLEELSLSLPYSVMWDEQDLWELATLEPGIPAIDSGYVPGGKLWPTLIATDGSKGGPGARYGNGSLKIGAILGGPVNPTWAEWYMGYPAAWTELLDWVTAWCPSARKKPLEIWSGSDLTQQGDSKDGR